MAEPSTLPKGEHCPIGSLNLHTYNAERTECIWCGPNHLAWQPGRWVSLDEDCLGWTTWGPLTQKQMKESTHG